MKKLIFLAALLAASAALAADHPEKWYQDRWCTEHKGVTEHRLDDGARVDCLTETHAVEFDFGKKWAESVGQALYYAARTEKKAGIVLIVGAGETDKVYVSRVKAIIDAYGLPCDLWTVKR